MRWARWAGAGRAATRLFCVGLLGAAGCAPKIGDHCTISTDCSVTGDRLCDATQPGGYCTVFNCEPNGCPDDSVCVAFDEPSCAGTSQSNRFQRTFCMATCDSSSDCRSVYGCIDISKDLGRRVVDVNPASQHICTVPAFTASVAASEADPAVCRPIPSNENGEAGNLSEAGTEAGASEGSAGDDASAVEGSASDDASAVDGERSADLVDASSTDGGEADAGTD